MNKVIANIEIALTYAQIEYENPIEGVVAVIKQRDALAEACQAAREWLGEPASADDLKWPHHRAKQGLRDKLDAALSAVRS